MLDQKGKDTSEKQSKDVSIQEGNEQWLDSKRQIVILFWKLTIQDVQIP